MGGCQQQGGGVFRVGAGKPEIWSADCGRSACSVAHRVVVPLEMGTSLAEPRQDVDIRRLQAGNETPDSDSPCFSGDCLLFSSCLYLEITANMKTRRKYRVYFFDYLWWLGEKYCERYPLNRLDGPMMFCNYYLVLISLPLMIFLPKMFSAFRNIVLLLAVSVGPFLLWALWLHKYFYTEGRRKAIMQRFSSYKYSTTRAFLIFLLPVLLYFGISIAMIEPENSKPQVSPEANREAIHQLLEHIKTDSTNIHRPKFKHNGTQ